MNKKFGILELILVIIVTAIISGGAVYFFNVKEGKEVKEENSVSAVKIMNLKKVDEVKEEKKVMSQIEALGETGHYIQTKFLNGKSGAAITLYSTDTKFTKNTDESCSKDFVGGNFKMEFDDDVGNVVSTFDIGETELAPDAIHLVGDAQKFVMIETYGSCNGNLFTFYAFNKEQNKLVPVAFSKSTSNQKFAMLKDISFKGNVVEIKSYDNSIAKWTTASYTWDAATSTFLSK